MEMDSVLTPSSPLGFLQADMFKDAITTIKKLIIENQPCLNSLIFRVDLEKKVIILQGLRVILKNHEFSATRKELPLGVFFIKSIFHKSNEDLLVFSSIMNVPDKNEQHA